MGITGLIPFLEKASRPVHLRELRGSTVAVDTYCWLHKGVFACAEKLARNEDTDVYIKYCMRYVDLLQSHDITPILVFDGRHLPAKALTESRRRESRKQAKTRAAELMRLGRYEEARSQLRRCVDVTHEMAWRLMCECRRKRRSVDCIVAPFEADAQLAWLDKAQLAQYIITEDSDLTLFGARRVIFKLDLTGAGLLVEADKLHLAMGCSAERYTFDKFRRMCILSGCDYLDSLPGIGLVKACKFMLKTEEDNMCRALKKLPQYLNMRQLEVSDGYIESFLQAEATFKHMYIYNPLQRRTERLNSLEECATDERYCINAGAPLECEQQALQLALGNLNPFTLKALDVWHPDTAAPTVKRHNTIWLASVNCSATQHAGTRKAADAQKASGSCAIYFKKFDFISRTVDADISANLVAENAKPFEAEICSMYQQEHCPLVSPLPKRRRRSDSSESSESAEYVTPTASKLHHNPFALTLEASLQKSPTIVSSSLLKALSPRKSAALASRALRSGAERGIFAGGGADVAIKSRFFAANRAVVTTALPSAKRSMSSPRGDDELGAEMETIETHAKHQLAQTSKLYYESPPTPRKSAAHSGSEEGATVATIGTAHSPTGSQESEDNSDTANTALKQKKENCEAILLSDDDDNVPNDALQTAKVFTIKPLQLSAFKSQTLRPSIDKGRTATGSQKKKAAVRSSGKTTAVERNQTRLSMFGFQKRPTL